MRRAYAMWVVVLALGATGVLQAQTTRSLDVQMKAAQHKAEVEGDLKGAIEQYRRIAQAPDRAVAAQALVRMAECYQKLGDAEARRIFEQVVRDYNDQKEAVSIARARLGSRVDSAEAGMSFRQVWQLPDNGTLGGTVSGAVSRDGRLLPYVDWAQHGDLFVHDLSSGTDRRLTTTATDRVPNATVEQFALDTSVSRDGRLLAYSWFRSDINRFELRVVDLTAVGVPQSRLLFDRPGVDWIAPVDWSPDGKWIAVKIQRPDKSSQIGVVSLSDGSLRVLKSLEWRGATALQFSTDGKFLAYDVPAADNTEQRDIFLIAADGTREVPVVVSPSQDEVIGWAADGKRLLFASDRSGAMGLWSVSVANGKADGQPQLVRSDIGNVVSLGLADSGKLYLASSLPFNASGDVYVAAIDAPVGKVLSPPVLAAQTYVGTNRFPAWSRDGKRLAYASVRGSGGATHWVIGVRSDAGLTREISPSPGLGLMAGLAWASDESFIVPGKDAKGRYGIFSVDAASGRSALIVEKGERQNPLGLAGVSPDGKTLYYAVRNFGDAFATVVQRDLGTGAEKPLGQVVGLRGARVSPDGRYVGLHAGTSDKPVISILPTAGGELRELLPPAPSKSDWRLGWAPDSSAVILIGREGLLRLPVDGSGPQKIDLKWNGDYPNVLLFSVHPDGQRIAFEAQPARKRTEVWALENFLPAKK